MTPKNTHPREQRRSTDRVRTQFGVLPYRVIMSGVLGAGMLRKYPIAFAVYVVIGAHSNTEDWSSWPGVETIAHAVGCSDRSVQRELVRLAKWGLIKVTRGGGRKAGGEYRSNMYVLATNPDTLDVTANRSEAPTPKVSPLDGAKGDESGIQPRHQKSLGVTSGGVSGDTLDVVRTTEQENNENKCAGARAHDPVWDCVCEVFRLNPITKSDRSRIGRIVRDLKAKRGDEHEIRTRVERYRRAWPDCECTPEALLKHWERFSKDEAPKDRRGRIEAPTGKYDGLRVVGVRNSAS